MVLERERQESKNGMAKVSIVERVREILQEYIPENGYELWDVEYGKVGKDYNLTVFIDKTEGTSTDDCEAVSRFLSERLDEEDVIDQNYMLIVSSPGMDRALLTDEHYLRYANTLVDVKLYKGFEGSKSWRGTLISRTEESLNIVAEDGKEMAIPRELVSKVRLSVII
jgi:ribosome maturation factor RimP